MLPPLSISIYQVSYSMLDLAPNAANEPSENKTNTFFFLKNCVPYSLIGWCRIRRLGENTVCKCMMISIMQKNIMEQRLSVVSGVAVGCNDEGGGEKGKSLLIRLHG